MKVELIYDSDCPSVVEARANLLHAFAAAHLDAKWTEWDRSSSSSAPAHVAHFGSPTVLVEGSDAAGEKPGEHISCCRLYVSSGGRYSGAPSVELLRMALTAPTPTAPPRHWMARVLAVPGILVGVLPIGGCPLCWPVYGGALSALGLTFLLSSAYLLPLTALFLFITVFTLAFRARRRQGYGPLALGLVATALLLWGKFSVESTALAYMGVGLLVCSAVWNSWPRPAAGPCPQCAPSGRDLVQLSATEKSS